MCVLELCNLLVSSHQSMHHLLTPDLVLEQGVERLLPPGFDVAGASAGRVVLQPPLDSLVVPEDVRLGVEVSRFPDFCV